MIHKVALNCIGTLALVLGVIGIFLPLLPTTPFLLLAAACYIKASPRAYNWLINHRFLGAYIRDYRAGRGIPLKTKIVTIAILWLTLSISAYKLHHIHIRVFLLLVGLGVTLHLITVKTKK